MARLTLCADDFGWSTRTSQRIAGLLAAGKLNATGCMTLMPGWAADAPLLDGLPPHVEIGLHLTLTDERPLTVMPTFAPTGTMPGIDPLAAMRRPPLGEIAAEIAAQFDAFEAATGRPPAFVDGHQHAHALPAIAGLVLAETAYRAPGAWLRDPSDRFAAMLARPFAGKALGSAWHARGFARAAGRRGLDVNDGFAGHYAFSGDWAALLPRFVRRPGERHLVMCHPGADDRPGDAIATARVREAAALDALPVAELAAAAGLTFPA